MIKGEKIFKPGDRVYHHKYGWLTVRTSTPDEVVAYNDIIFPTYKSYDLKGDDLMMLSFTEYTVEIKGFSLEQPERKETWELIYDDYQDSSYVGQSGFMIYLRNYYKVPERREDVDQSI